jgi:hypothetical protein
MSQKWRGVICEEWSPPVYGDPDAPDAPCFWCNLPKADHPVEDAEPI